MTTENKKIGLLLGEIFVSILAGHLIWFYLRNPTQGALSFLVGIGVFLLIRNHVRIESKPLWIFAFFFALSLVLSSHIEIKGGMTGLWNKTYITDYSWLDVVAFAVFLYVIPQLVMHLLSWLGRVSASKVFLQDEDSIWASLMKKPLWFYVLILVICWLPWALSWYPGFVYGDSISSVRQAQGLVGFNNHHPITYTLWLKIWLTMGKAIHDVTFGAALYTLAQMIIVAWGLAWSARWMFLKKVHPAYCVFTLAYFALTPFFAQNHISMWKDPFFSVAGLIFCMRLYDFFKDDAAITRKNLAWLGFFAVVICLFRNNGAYVTLFTAIALVCLCWFYRSESFKKKSLKISGALFALSAIVIVMQGPIFARLHMSPNFSETVGIPLNQMARIVTYDGKMSARNKEFMNHLLPIEKIKGLYSPGYVDKYKWARGFNQGYLNSHKKEFFSNYFSMVAKNPRLAFESWELQTVGFWSITHFTYETGNVSKGCLWCLKWWSKDHGLKNKNLLENKFFNSRSVFSQYDATIPLGVITWLILLISVLSFARKNVQTQVALLPLLGLIATLLLASPWHYWERYGYWLSLALPMLLVMLVKEAQTRNSDKDTREKQVA